MTLYKTAICLKPHLHRHGSDDDSPRIHKSSWILVNPSNVVEEFVMIPHDPWRILVVRDRPQIFWWERGGSVVECRTPEREVGGSKPTAAVLCPWARHFTPRKYWLITQEAVAPSRHDWKIVDWDVKPQHKQTKRYFELLKTIVAQLRFKVGVAYPSSNRKAILHIRTATVHAFVAIPGLFWEIMDNRNLPSMRIHYEYLKMNYGYSSVGVRVAMNVVRKFVVDQVNHGIRRFCDGAIKTTLRCLTIIQDYKQF